MHKIYTCKYFTIWSKYTHISKSIFNLRSHANRHFSDTADLRTHLRLTLFTRGDLSSVFQKRSTTSLVVTCDSVNFLLGNHMKCFN